MAATWQLRSRGSRASTRRRRTWNRRITSSPEPQRKEGGKAPQRFGWRNALVFLGLLLIDYVVVSLLFSAAANPRVEIRIDRRSSRSSATATSRRSLRRAWGSSRSKAVRYPDKEAPATTNFSTEVPEFADQAGSTDWCRAGRRGHRGTDGARDAAVADAPHVPRVEALLFGLWYLFMRRAGGGATGMFSFGRSRAKKYEPTTERVTFDDVHAASEAEQARRGRRLPP